MSDKTARCMPWGPTHYPCDYCEEEGVIMDGEVDVADYPDGDEDGRQRMTFTCQACSLLTDEEREELYDY